jgi:fused signal recognition particle receptor
MNALNQAREFNKAVPLTGLVVTKLDGTSKGGMVIAIQKELKLPVKFIGVGEQADDLQPFDAHDFAEALFSQPELPDAADEPDS